MGLSLDLQEKKVILKILKIISLVSFILVCLLSVSPLIGLFIPAYNGNDILTIFRVKAYYVKVIGIICLVVAAFGYMLRLTVYGKKHLFMTFLKNPWNLLFLMIIVWGIVSFALHDQDSFGVMLNGYDTPNEGLLGFVSYAGIYAASSMIIKKEHRNIIFNILLGGSLLLAFCCFLREECGLRFILERQTYCFAYSGTWINPNHYAYYLCVVSALALGKFLVTGRKNKYLSAYYITVFFANYIILLKNRTLGAFLALVVASVFFLVISIKRKQKNRVIALCVIAFLCAVLANKLGGYMIHRDIPGIFETIGKTFRVLFGGGSQEGGQSTIEAMENVETNRLRIWVCGAEIIFDSFKNALIGVGPDMALSSYQYYFFQYFPRGEVSHNEYLHLGVSLGIPGLLFYFGGVVTFIIYGLKNLKKMPDEIYLSVICMGTYAVSAFFGITLPISEFIFWTMLGITNSWFQNKNEIEIVNKEYSSL